MKKIYNFIIRIYDMFKRAFVYIEVMDAASKLDPGDPRRVLVEGVIPSFLGLNYDRDAEFSDWKNNIRAIFDFIF